MSAPLLFLAIIIAALVAPLPALFLALLATLTLSKLA
jgi:hypothetical protein